jgi:PAS domain S-box-containing protein
VESSRIRSADDIVKGRETTAPRRTLLAAALAVPIAIQAVGAWISWTATWEEATVEVARTADAAAEYARAMLESHRLRGQQVALLLRDMPDEAIRAERASLHLRLRDVLELDRHGEDFSAYVIDRTGRILVTSDTPDPPPVNLLDRPYFVAMNRPDAPDWLVGEVARGRANGRDFFTVTMRLDGRANGLPPGAFGGVINISITPAMLVAGFTRLRGTSEDVLSLVRQDGTLLARTLELGIPPPWPRHTTDATLAAMASGPRRIEALETSTLDRVPRLIVYRAVEGWPAYAAAARERSVIIDRWLRRVAVLLGIGIPATIALGLLAWRVRRADLAAVAARASLEQRVAERTAELARRSDQLSESEARLRVALEAADLGTWEVDLLTRIAQRSPRTLAIFGAPAEDMIGPYPGWADRIHADDQAAVADAFARLAEGTSDLYTAEYRFHHPEGRVVWVESRARVVAHDRTGRPLRLAGTVQDITARREAEERRALLAREVDHRAKNALAVVQAALRLTPRTTLDAYAAAVEGRVAALARAHTLLADQRWAGASLRALLAGELAPFTLRGRDDSTVTMAGPAVRVAPSAAQSLSLAFHELTTNAVKYGALSRPQGRLAITWSIRPATGDLVLLWEERGGPAVAGTPSRRGFGSRLVAATIRDQLGGILVQAWQPEGLTVEIQVSLCRVVAPEPATEADPQPVA